jgi:hypothetical protein
MNAAAMPARKATNSSLMSPASTKLIPATSTPTATGAQKGYRRRKKNGTRNAIDASTSNQSGPSGPFLLC